MAANERALPLRNRDDEDEANRQDNASAHSKAPSSTARQRLGGAGDIMGHHSITSYCEIFVITGNTLGALFGCWLKSRR